ncbi:MAG: RNHCP domain-containing protein [Pseudomonadales bacterium]|nr:RNHCP domain-containing protein [Pseudomonadales bacterium]
MSRSKSSKQGRIFHDRKSRQRESEFRCCHCRHMISTTSYGTHHRNHCPLCLWSKHVDEKPGDRASPCQGKMEPISVWVKSDKEWALVHRCTSCGVVKTNRIAGDDNPFALLSLASKPMAQPPFPVEKPG